MASCSVSRVPTDGNTSLALKETKTPQPVQSIDANNNLNLSLLYKTPLTHLNCSFDVVTPSSHTETLKQVIRRQCRIQHTDVMIVHAIRQPGCVSCREHGMQLSEFVSTDRRLGLMGIVKEVGTNDEAIVQFYKDYFRGHYLYVDKKWNVYKALGGHKLSLTRALYGFFRSQRRFRRKGIDGNSSGASSDSFVQGGVLFFDRSGKLRLTVEAKAFMEMDMKAVQAAVAETRRLSRLEKEHKELSSTASRTTVDTLDDSSSSGSAGGPGQPQW